ncbi:MAG: dihydropteroate synthase [Candidatus Omnitrophota bacterium]|nr:dihydropteroate synthase [Candidatus Omnitrophota bacterium]
MRIFRFSYRKEVENIMHDIGVDPYGIKIMLPKTSAFLIHLNSISNISANIIKQEMLSLGADAALAKGALSGKLKKTDCLIIGRLDQLNTLTHKLKLQPFGLLKLARELDQNIKNYSLDDFTLKMGKYSLKLKEKTHIMGIINVTPDSFSGDGLYNSESKDYRKLALIKAEQMLKEGADIIDIGGQSSRPGAKSISIKEEMLRTIAVVKLLSKRINAPISIDTTRAVVAKAAFDNGAVMLNDISGLRNNQLTRIAADYDVAVVIMHMLGVPLNMQKVIAYESFIDDVAIYLKQAIKRAESYGIKPNKIVVDPGIGFGKTLEHNLQILKKLADFKILGKPILLGPSRKSFIGKILGTNIQNRTIGTLATCVLAAQRGAHILRVHDVLEVNQALRIVQAIGKNINA